MLNLDEDVMKDFLIEAHEHLDAAENQIVRLEKNPKDQDTLNQLFGAIHSIKGAAGYLGIMSVHNLTHAFESVLEKLRRGKVIVTTENYDLLFQGLDGLKKAIKKIETENDEEDTSALIKAFEEFENVQKTETASVKKTVKTKSNKTEVKVSESTNDTKEIVDEFVQEAEEHLTSIERALLEFEKDPGNIKSVEKIFRGVHSLKGSAGYIGLIAIHDLAHALENVLTFIQNSSNGTSGAVIEQLFQVLDLLKTGVKLASSGKVSQFDPSEMISKMETLTKEQTTLKVESVPVKTVQTDDTKVKKSDNANQILNSSELAEDMRSQLNELIQLLERLPKKLKKKDLNYINELLENLSLQSEYRGLDHVWSIVRNLQKEFAQNPDKDQLSKSLQAMMVSPSDSVLAADDTKEFLTESVLVSEEEYDALFGDYDDTMGAIFATTLDSNLKVMRSSFLEIDELPIRATYRQALEKLLVASRYLDANWLQSVMDENIKLLHAIGNNPVNHSVRSRLSKDLQKLESLLGMWKSRRQEKNAPEPSVNHSASSILEDDHELIEIFFENSKNHISRIQKILTDANRRGFSGDEMTSIAESIDRLKVSANYMDYKFMIDKLAEIKTPIDEVISGKAMTLDQNTVRSIMTNVNHVVDFVCQVCNKTKNDFLAKPDDQNISSAQSEAKPVETSRRDEPRTVTPPAVESKQLDEVFWNEIETNLLSVKDGLSSMAEQRASLADFVKIYEALETMKSTLNFLKHPKPAIWIDEQIDLLEPLVSGHVDRLERATVNKLLVPWNSLLDYLSSKKKIKLDWSSLKIAFIEENVTPVLPPEVLVDRRSHPRRRADDVAETDENIGAAMKAQQTIRVETNKVDDLMALVGELVVNRSSFIQLGEDFKRLYHEIRITSDTEKKFLRLIKDFSLKIDSTTLGLGRITNDLQDKVMRVRMIPIGQLFNRFPRMVRELSRVTNKKVDLELYGEDTELDKTVIEQIADPLIHLIRNSIDHGIELSEHRLQSGKPASGRIVLRAFHESNQIVVEVEDDGAGLNLERITKRAIERGLVSKNEAHLLSKKEIIDFIFKPNFSTSEKITEISGRGVGMDVVRRNIEKLNGAMTVDTEPGQGTRFTIRIPLTLAIIKALLVRADYSVYCIPLTSVVETLRINPADISTIEQNEVLQYRDKVIALLRLSEVFDLEDRGLQDQDRFVVVVNPGGTELGLVIDAPVGEQDIVIKPLEEAIISTPGISGAAILGGGEITLILDVPSLTDLAINQKKQSRRNMDTHRQREYEMNEG